MPSHQHHNLLYESINVSVNLLAEEKLIDMLKMGESWSMESLLSLGNVFNLEIA
jgi:hypothetical protein